MKPKIFLLISDITTFGGMQRVVSNLCNLLCSHYEITLISCYKANETLPATYNFPTNVKIIYFNEIYSDFKLDSFWDKVKFSYRINQLLPNDSRNILIVNNLLYPFVKKKSTIYIRLFHNSFENAYKKYLYKKPLFPPRIALFDKLIVLSSKELNHWQKLHKNIEVIPNFLPSIPKESSPLQSKIVLSVGRMDKGDQKGFFRLVDVWEIVQKDLRFGEWKLHIVGDGLLKEQIQEKIKTKNLQDSIILKPFTNTIEQEYLQASIYVMTSHFEGLPMVLVESASFGLPQISFDINTGPSDIIENEKSGFLIPDGDLEGYAEKLKTLMQNQNLRESMGKRAKEIAQEKFSKEVILLKWQKMFDS